MSERPTPAMMRARRLAIVSLAGIAFLPASLHAAQIVLWDFGQGAHGWVGNRRIGSLASTPEGLSFVAAAADPWIEGPAVDLPPSDRIRVTIRMKSRADSGAQLFYGQAFSEASSTRFSVNTDGGWHEYTLVLPSLGSATRFRLDPCQGPGPVTVAWIRLESLPTYVAPPAAPFLPLDRPNDAEPAELVVSPLRVRHFGRLWGAFAIDVAEEEVASGHTAGRLAYIENDEAVWVDLAEAEIRMARHAERRGFSVSGLLTDPSGGRWFLQRTFLPAEAPGVIRIETTISCDRDRQLLHFPWLTLFPGLGTFGPRKTQALLSGVEYLADEPSSSQADLRGPAHLRRLPDPVKFTFPLMALAHGDRCLGLVWEPSSLAAPVFDSPDRTFHSGAHLFGLFAPAVGPNRFENELYAHTPIELRGGRAIQARCELFGAMGSTVVPAIERYVERKGLPSVLVDEDELPEAARLLAAGWLDSDARREGLWRHAVWGDNFPPQPAADAPAYMNWLATRVGDGALAARLRAVSARGLEALGPEDPYLSGVSHVRFPTAPLLFGRVPEYVAARAAEARRYLANFDGRGVRPYRRADDRPDYAKTHFANHANGLAFAQAARIVEAASLSGDEALIGEALDLLDRLTLLYRRTVPRGAQTWEVPLHTPDILAAAHMVQAYTLAYEMTGREPYFAQARYWAWTGLPFVYLSPPTAGEIGLYATTPVLGATNWVAPVWIGLPVQWCGLVYGAALHRLARHDPEGPWRRIARGITLAGLQMTWPREDEARRGLLPDIFDLKAQRRDGPAINPGTVQATLPELFDRGSLYDFRRLPRRGWLAHSPCEIESFTELEGSTTLALAGFGDLEYRLLIARVAERPRSVRTRVAGSAAPFSETEFSYDARNASLIVRLRGASEVAVELSR